MEVFLELTFKHRTAIIAIIVLNETVAFVVNLSSAFVIVQSEVNDNQAAEQSSLKNFLVHQTKKVLTSLMASRR